MAVCVTHGSSQILIMHVALLNFTLKVWLHVILRRVVVWKPLKILVQLFRCNRLLFGNILIALLWRLSPVIGCSFVFLRRLWIVLEDFLRWEPTSMHIVINEISLISVLELIIIWAWFTAHTVLSYWWLILTVAIWSCHRCGVLLIHWLQDVIQFLTVTIWRSILFLRLEHGVR